MRGIILAAGKGSRLNGTAGELPKCLVKLGGQSLIERQIAVLKQEQWRDWLDPQAEVKGLIRPLPAGTLTVRQVM